MTVEEWADEIMKKYYLKHYYPHYNIWYDYIKNCNMFYKSKPPISSGQLRNSVPKGTAYFRIETHYFDIDGNELHLGDD